jgi:zinc protease
MAIQIKKWITLFVLVVWGNLLFAAPNIQQWQDKSGAKVYFAPANGLPMVDVRIVFNAGSARDGDKKGVAALTAALLDTGTGKLDASAVAEQFESVGAQFGVGLARDMAWVTLRSLTESAILDKALQIAHDILVNPAFNYTDFERDRQRTLLGLKRQEESPAAIGQKAFFKALYGTHPYASPVSGKLETVEKLTRADILSFYQQYYVAHNAVVVVVGDLDRPATEKMVEQLLSGLPAGNAAGMLPVPKDDCKGVVIKKIFPSAQTHIFSGALGVKRHDPDYFELYVGNHILGGSGLVSLITEEVREKRGLAYSAYSYFSPMAQFGPFMMGLQTRNDQADEAFEVLTETVSRFVKEGPTEKQLKAAKSNITGGFALRLDSNRKIAEYIAMIAFYDLPIDYLEKFSDKVKAVSTRSIRDAFSRRLKTAEFKTVMVGNIRE